jgi:hypothetical protein
VTSNNNLEGRAKGKKEGSRGSELQTMRKRETSAFCVTCRIERRQKKIERGRVKESV